MIADNDTVAVLNINLGIRKSLPQGPVDLVSGVGYRTLERPEEVYEVCDLISYFMGLLEEKAG